MKYGENAERVHALLAEMGVPEGGTLLEAACGTGNYLAPLSQWYDVSGFDLQEDMLAAARAKLDVPLFQGDMRAFSVAKPFDALVCMFSSIGYMRDAAELEAAFTSFARAVKHGGAVIVEPWIEPSVFRDGAPSLQTYEDEDLKIARASVARRDGTVAVLKLHWLIAARGEHVEYFSETHRMWMPTNEVILAAFDAAGLDATFHPDGLLPQRGLYLAIRR